MSSGTRTIIIVVVSLYIITLLAWWWDRSAVDRRARQQERAAVEEEYRTAAERRTIDSTLHVGQLRQHIIDSLAQRSASSVAVFNAPFTDAKIYPPVRSMGAAALHDSLVHEALRPD
jgi:hypothetical protein